MPAKNKIKLAQFTSPSAYSTQFLNPQRIINQLEIYPGMKVAHFGCGTGYFTFPIAVKIGATGKIWALDILEHKVDLMRSNAKALGTANVIVDRVNLEKVNGSGLENESMDWVIMVNVLYQNEKKSQIIGEAKRILKEGGHILLIDWKTTSVSLGPGMENRVAREELLADIKRNELKITKELDISALYFGIILMKQSQ